MKLAAAVILYHPNVDVFENIQSYSSVVEKVWIMDNSEKQSPLIELELKKIKNCLYLHDSCNEGIAVRLNQACIQAKEEGYDWMLTMDQDSWFDQENISRYLNCFENDKGKANVAVYGVQYDSVEDQSPQCCSTTVNQVITSGSLVNLSLFTSIGGFNEELFIDQVDFEYCYRSITKGYSVIQFRNIFLQHKLGNMSTHRSLMSFKKTPRSLHSPQRLYYMTRNFFYVSTRYSKIFKKDVGHSKKDLLYRIKNNLLYNPRRFSVLRYILSGFLDYKRKKMGKLQN